MPIRNTHRVGDYLMRSDYNGLVYYASEMVEIWNGAWVHHTEYEIRNPQEFVQARKDPIALRNVRPEGLVAAPLPATGCIGETTVIRPEAPATHVFPFLDVLLDEEGNLIVDENGTCLVEEA